LPQPANWCYKIDQQFQVLLILPGPNQLQFIGGNDAAIREQQRVAM
jgi:hypothetical protein